MTLTTFSILLRSLCSSSDKALRLLLGMSFLVIAFSSGTLSLVQALMRGFHTATAQALRAAHADLIITPHQQSTQGIEVIQSRLAPLAATLPIQSIVQLEEMPVLLTSNNSESAQACLLRCRSDYAQEEGITITTQLARALGVAAGQSVTLLYRAQDNDDNEPVTRRKVLIDKVADTQGEEALELILCGPLLTNLLEPASTKTVGIRLSAPAATTYVKARIEQHLADSATCHTWDEFFPGISDALKLEHLIARYIGIIIALLGFCTLFATLCLVITAKRSLIALLYALGLSQRTLIHRSALLGGGLSFLAATTGMIVSWALCACISYTKCIALPDAYYIQFLPAHISFWHDIVILFTFGAMGAALSAIAVHLSGALSCAWQLVRQQG
jgi:ABC-type lipoprotein release transport system permease subunit